MAARWGEAAARLHAVPKRRVSDLGLPEPPLGGIAESQRQEADEALHALAGDLSQRVRRRCADRVAESCPEPGAFRLLHADLVAEHILVDAADGELRAILDRTDAELGPPACDFAGLWAYAGDAALDGALAAYGAEAGDDHLAAQARFFGLRFLLTAVNEERRRGAATAVRRLMRCLVARMG